jgi:chromosomal replication initiation ATPase DnaA
VTATRLPQQLPLALAHAPQFGRDAFLPGASNEAALRLIDSWPGWPSPVVLLTGPPGAGKTHLAHVWAERAGARILEAGGLSIATLPDIGTGGALVVEDIDAGDIREAALFHVINRTKEVGAWLLLTARDPAERWPVRLPDLRSRLRSASPVALGAPDEDLLRKVLVKLFADRQLLVEKGLVDYLIVRMERSLSFAGALVRALDAAALAAGRPLNRGVAAGVLQDLRGDPEEFAERQ